MKKVHAIVVMILAVAVLMAVCAPAFAADKPQDTIILKGNPMGGVKFQHNVHSSKDRAAKCDTCHHAAKPEKASKTATESCADCHTKAAAAPMKTTYKLAFHDAPAKKGVCIDCHTAQNAKGKKAPTKCTECHKKENA